MSLATRVKRMVSKQPKAPAAPRKSDSERLMDLGELLEEKKVLVGAKQAYREAIHHDPESLPIDEQLLASSAQMFRHRRIMARFVRDRLPKIRERAEATRETPLTDPKIFVFWDQGFDAAPPIVRNCLERIRALSGGNLVELERESLLAMVDIPYTVRSQALERRAAYSDYARSALLRKYGGIWMDATCLATDDVVKHTEELLDSGFFAFRYKHARISNWFLASNPGNYIPSMMVEGLNEYWRDQELDVSYFFYHHMFECFYYLDPKFAAIWDATANVSAHPPHRLQRAFQEPYSEDLLRELAFSSFVHKLSYKKTPKPGNLLEFLCSDQAVPALAKLGPASPDGAQ